MSQVKLHTSGQRVEGIDALRQSIELLLQTSRGSVPHHPNEGCALGDYLDLPVSEARPRIVSDLSTALAQQVPGVAVRKIEVLPDGGELGNHRFTVRVTWVPRGLDTEQSTEALL